MEFGGVFMRAAPLRAGSGALIVIAVMFFLEGSGNFTAVLVPAAAHELGHLFALWMLGLPVRSFRIELQGFCIEYSGSTGALGHALAAAAGPLAGLAFSYAASLAGGRLGSEWLCLTAGVSLLLSLFNLLPALPLDGGAILLHISGAILGEQRARVLVEITGLLVCAAMLGGGFYLLLQGKGAAVLLAAVWLLLAQENGRGLVKRREMI